MPSTVTVKNIRAKPVTLVVEPLGREYTLEPSAELVVIEEGEPQGSNLEIHVEEHHIVIWTRANVTVRVLKNGEEI